MNINDVAEAAGVSRGSVSNYLNNKKVSDKIKLKIESWKWKIKVSAMPTELIYAEGIPYLFTIHYSLFPQITPPNGMGLSFTNSKGIYFTFAKQKFHPYGVRISPKT